MEETQTRELMDLLWPIPTREELNDYPEYLSRKYGMRTIEECQRRERAFAKGSSGSFDEFISFLLDTGLVADNTPHLPYRGRLSLAGFKAFVKAADIRDDFSLLDFGCGDGRLDIGIALSFPQMRALYALDRNSKAFSRLEKNIDALPGESQSRARAKIRHLNLDFEDPDFQKEVSNLEPGGIDIAMSAFLRHDYLEFSILNDRALQYMVPILNQNGAIIRFAEGPSAGHALEKFQGCFEYDATNNSYTNNFSNKFVFSDQIPGFFFGGVLSEQKH